MAMNFSIIKPEAGTNLATNPSLETATTGYSASGGGSSVASQAGDAAFGAHSLLCTMAGAGNTHRVNVALAITNGVTYTVSFYARRISGNAALHCEIDSGSVAGSFTTVDAWTRFSFTTVASTVPNIYWWLGAAGAFLLDGVQLEAAAYATTYIDGDQPGCRWTGTRHASTSTRDGQSREGGKIITFYQRGGAANYANGLPGHVGLGMPPMANVQVPNAQRGGVTHQRSIPGARTITLQLGLDGTSLDNLHTLRQNFIDLVKPDLVYPRDQQFWLRYYNDDVASANKVVRAKCAYESGLDWTQPKGFSVDVPLRLSAPDPYWYEENDTSAVLSYINTITNANGILKRDTTGLWAALGTGVSGGATSVQALVYGKDGTLYAGGNFTSVNSVAATAGIAQWNGSAWTALGTGVTGGTQVFALVIAADGTLYAAGDFTQMGGVANTAGIAKWSGSAWSAVGTGITSGTTLIKALAFDRSGNLYAGGGFSGMGGVANTTRIAKWNGSVWSSLTASPPDDVVYALVADASNNLYVGGIFTTIGGVTVTGLGKYSSAGVWSSIGTVTGVSAYVAALAIGLDGTLYAGGSFTTIGGVSANYIAKWNGTAWSAMGSGMNGNVYCIFVYPALGGLLIGGDFTTAGGVTLSDKAAIWYGNAFGRIEVNLPGTASIRAAVAATDSKTLPSLVLGYNTTGTASGPSVGTVTVTNGTAEAAPKVYLTGPGGFLTLWNVTNNQVIQFNSLTLLAGETAVLDLTPGNVSFTSSFRGSLMNYLLAASQTDVWRLLPGSNFIAAFMTGGSGATTMALVWKDTHWSIDGVL